MKAINTNSSGDLSLMQHIPEIVGKGVKGE